MLPPPKAPKGAARRIPARGRRVGQLVFAQMDAAAEKPYRGKYQGQRGATGSRVFLDTELHNT